MRHFGKYVHSWRGKCKSLRDYVLLSFTQLTSSSIVNPFLIIESWGGGLGPRGIWGGVQGVGQVAWVNTRPLVCDSPYGKASGGQEEPFSRLALAV